MAGKPTDRRIQRTYKILHEALVELILEKGYDKVTVQDVIDRANVGRSTFYSHFKDLEDLFLRGFDNLWSQFEAHFSEQASQTVDVRTYAQIFIPADAQCSEAALGGP